MVELVFARNGWRRTGSFGGNQADVDVMREHPVTEEAALVQVSLSSMNIVDDTNEKWLSRCFLAVHSPA